MALIGALGQVAEHHGGEVPLHGRLFAQWMHYAFPHECPYPHTSTSAVVPLSPSEFTKQTGASNWVSKENVVKHIKNEDAGRPVSEPLSQWTMEEELSVGVPSQFRTRK